MMNKKELKIEATEVRKTLLHMIYHANTGHTGGDLSSTEIVTTLYNRILNIDPKNPDDPKRDRFILSKGHSVEVYYTVLARCGFFPVDWLKTFSKRGSLLSGHPNNKIPGIEMNTGALGHGLSVSVGMALALKKKGYDSKVYCLMGDGEHAEGSIWEAAMAASNYKLDNLVAIIDRNNLQISGNTEDVMALEPIKDKYESFGWNVVEMDGNNIDMVVDTLEMENKTGKPLFVIAHTVKGKGVKEMENVAKWHHGVPSPVLYESAMNQLNKNEENLKNE
ncbi:MAG: transketolase [Bacteroidaceae bacterium]